VIECPSTKKQRGDKYYAHIKILCIAFSEKIPRKKKRGTPKQPELRTADILKKTCENNRTVADLAFYCIDIGKMGHLLPRDQTGESLGS